MNQKRGPENKKIGSERQKRVGNSTVMGVIFERLVESTLCADGGSDINFLPPNECDELNRGK